MSAQRPLSAFDSRLHLLVGLVVVVATLALGGWTWRQVTQDREQILTWFSDERQRQLLAVAARVEEDFQDVGDDLELATWLVAQGAGPEEWRRSLTALLRTVRAYRVAVVYDAQCHETLAVTDPRWSDEASKAAVFKAIETTISLACGQATAHVETSKPIKGAPWMRVFATPIPGGGGAVALAVDTGPILDRLSAVTADASAELIVLGPHGVATPATSPQLARALERDLAVDAPAFARALTEMRAGKAGTTMISAREAAALGFPFAALLVAYTPIHFEEGTHWSAATLVSTLALQDHEQMVLRRVIFGAGGAMTLLLGFGLYVMAAARREAATVERLRSAEQIAHLRERAERILDHIPSIVLAMDARLRVTAANEAFRRQHPAFVQGTGVDEALSGAPTSSLDELRALIGRARAEGRPRSAVARPLALFGEDGVFTVHAVPITPSSRDVDLLLVIEDTTAARKLQDQVLHMEKLATIGVLASGIAHEIGTPLGVIRGRAEYAAAKLGPQHPQVASLEIIVVQIDRVVRTVRALLDFANIRKVAVSAVDLRGQARAVVELMRFEAERRRVTLVEALPEDLPPIAADPDQAQQVIVNLVMNALDACEPGGLVSIRAEREQVDGEPRLRMEVVDNGRGVAPEHLHRIFDPFYTTKKRGQGTGLGLAIVSQIVRDHGGEVTLRSEEGRGTIVQVHWPLTGDASPERKT